MHINSLTPSAKQIKIIIDNKNKHIIKKTLPCIYYIKEKELEKK